MTSKRGHDILNPLWRVYVDASQIAWRWSREVQGGTSLDDELDRLLSDE